MGTRLYIVNMSWDTTEDALMAVLSEGGRTLKVSEAQERKPRGGGGRGGGRDRW